MCFHCFVSISDRYKAKRKQNFIQIRKYNVTEFINKIWTYIFVTSSFVFDRESWCITFRFLSFKYGLTKKKVETKSSFTYCYYERGQPSPNSPTLLLVHGYSSSKDSYLGLLKHLPKRIHTIVLDLPGHGESSVKDEDLSIMLFVRSVHEVNLNPI